MYIKNSALATLLITLGLSGISTNSFAEAGDISLGVKVGQAVVSAFDDVQDISAEEGVAAGFSIGYSFARNWTTELEFVRGTTEVTGPAANVDVDIKTAALYAAYRSPGPLYVLAKIGYVRTELSAVQTESYDETELSYGVGGGYKVMPNLGLEIDYTIVEEDTDWLMLSAKFHF